MTAIAGALRYCTAGRRGPFGLVGRATRAIGGRQSTSTERPEVLAVEEGLFYPARLSADGNRIELSQEVDDPGVLDDAVDELIEHVLIRGGWVAIVGDGALSRHDGVALARR